MAAGHTVSSFTRMAFGLHGLAFGPHEYTKTRIHEMNDWGFVLS
jgi:hypothetical protein